MIECAVCHVPEHMAEAHNRVGARGLRVFFRRPVLKRRGRTPDDYVVVDSGGHRWVCAGCIVDFYDGVFDWVDR